MVATLERAHLSTGECWSRLHTARVGRLSYTERAMPAIRAVPFVVDDTDDADGTDDTDGDRPGSVVIAMRASASHPGLFDQPTIVAFEAGEWDGDRRTGWSVHFIGKALRVPDHELPDLAATGLSSWIDGEPGLYVRVSVELLDGQRVCA